MNRDSFSSWKRILKINSLFGAGLMNAKERAQGLNLGQPTSIDTWFHSGQRFGYKSVSLVNNFCTIVMSINDANYGISTKVKYIIRGLNQFEKIL